MTPPTSTSDPPLGRIVCKGLRSRQLLHACEEDSLPPETRSAITESDLAIARRALALLADIWAAPVADDPPFPAKWAQSRKSISAFLSEYRRWGAEKLPVVERTVAEAQAAEAAVEESRRASPAGDTTATAITFASGSLQTTRQERPTGRTVAALDVPPAVAIPRPLSGTKSPVLEEAPGPGSLEEAEPPQPSMAVLPVRAMRRQRPCDVATRQASAASDGGLQQQPTDRRPQELSALIVSGGATGTRDAVASSSRQASGGGRAGAARVGDHPLQVARRPRAYHDLEQSDPPPALPPATSSSQHMTAATTSGGSDDDKEAHGADARVSHDHEAAAAARAEEERQHSARRAMTAHIRMLKKREKEERRARRGSRC